jgi:hypothetical protein
MCIRNIGMGIAFMPIMTSSMAGIPTAEVNRASAVNNIVQRVASAFGLAVMTSVLTTQMAQQFSSRASLSVAGAAADPHLGGGGMLGWRGTVQTAAFGGALGDLFLLTAGVTALCAVMALMLPAKPAAGAGSMLEGAPVPPPQAVEAVAAAAVAEPPPVRRSGSTRRAPSAPPVAAAVATSENSLS